MSIVHTKGITEYHDLYLVSAPNFNLYYTLNPKWVWTKPEVSRKIEMPALSAWCVNCAS